MFDRDPLLGKAFPTIQRLGLPPSAGPAERLD